MSENDRLATTRINDDEPMLGAPSRVFPMIRQFTMLREYAENGCRTRHLAKLLAQPLKEHHSNTYEDDSGVCT